MERCGQENLHCREKMETFLAYLSYFSNRGIKCSAEAAASEHYPGKKEAHTLIRCASTGKPEIPAVTMPVRAWFKRAQSPTSTVRSIPLDWQPGRAYARGWELRRSEPRANARGNNPSAPAC